MVELNKQISRIARKSRDQKYGQNLLGILDLLHAGWRPLIGPLKRPTNHYCMSVSKKVFQQPLIEAKRG